MTTILEVENISKIYTEGQKPSLDKVTFKVGKGEFIGIMGASGSGKTTLLNVLSTIDKITDGEIYLNGININSLNDVKSADFRKDHLGFIFQEYLLLDSLTIKENIAVPLTLQKLLPKEIEERIKALAEKFGILAQLDKYPSELSGGQRQRASAARAIVKEPSILFADEPTGALDSYSTTELLDALQNTNNELKTTILMVTHDPYAASFATRILIFKDGQITQELHKCDHSRKHFYEKIVDEIAQIDTNR